MWKSRRADAIIESLLDGVRCRFLTARRARTLAHRREPLVDWLISTQVPAFAQAAFTKAGRVGVFRRFVVKEFGPAAVVDVAGGKGELSFELENLHDVACVVVDPRAPMLDDVSQRFRRFRARGFLDNGDEALSEGFRRRWREHEEAGVELALRRPRHLRLFFDGALVDWTVSGGDDFFAAAARRWTEEVLIGESSRKQNYAKATGGSSSCRRRPTLWRRRTTVRDVGARGARRGGPARGPALRRRRGADHRLCPRARQGLRHRPVLFRRFCVEARVGGRAGRPFADATA